VVAFATASRALAGTDLDNHHRFMREAEALRFRFVQALNRIHAEQLAYTDDIARSRDAEAERRTRVDPSAWRVLEEFRFRPASAATRLQSAAPALFMLLAWLSLALAACAWSARRLETSP
jgi:ABC-2 type transport system permease protein